MVTVRPPSVYLLIGKEEFLKREFITELRTSLFQSSSDFQLNFEEFYGQTTVFPALSDFAQTLPFASPRRLAILWEVERLSKDDHGRLKRLLDSLPPSVVLVMVSGEASVKKNALLGELALKAEVIPCHAPFEKNLPAWLAARARKKKIFIDGAAAALLIEKTGPQTAGLTAALEQLALYIHPRKKIDAADVERLMGRSVQYDAFLLAEVLLRQEAPAALRMITTMLAGGTRATEILPVLAAQWDRLGKAKALLEAGAPASEIGEQLNIHTFYLEKTLRQALSVSNEFIQTALTQLLSCDEAIKTGRLDEGLALEALALGHCLGKKPFLFLQGVDF